MSRAFTAAEQSAILLTNVDNSSSQCYSRYSTNEGNNTQDKVFLLSYAEVNKYLGVTYDNSNNTKSRSASTAYAIAKGAYTSDSNKTADGQAAGWWWLRSPGNNQNNVANVNTDGSLNNNVNNERGSVRHASPCLPEDCPCERQRLCPGEKEYRSLSQGLRCRCGTDQRQCPWKNMPTEARTADEIDRLSYICLWDAWVFYSRIPRAAFMG